MKPLNQLRNTHKRMLCCAQALGHVRLFATAWTVVRQAPLSLGILQAGILEWVAMPSSRGSSQPRDRTQVSCIAGRFFISRLTRKVPYKRMFFNKKNSLFVLSSWYYLLYQCFQYKMVLLPLLLINRNSLLCGFMLINGILTYLNAKLTTLKMGTNFYMTASHTQSSSPGSPYPSALHLSALSQ